MTSKPRLFHSQRTQFARAHRFATELMEHDAFGAAASIAFWVFLSFVPLLVLVGYLVGLVARTRGIDALIGPILEIVPGTAEELVTKELERLAGARGTGLAPLGIAGFLWTASSGLHRLMEVFENAAKVTPRPWWKKRAIALAWVAIGLATACATAWLLVRADSAINGREPPSASSSASASASAVVARAPERVERPDRPPARVQPAAPMSAAQRARANIRGRVHTALHTPGEKILVAAMLLVVGVSLLAGFYRYAVEHPPRVRRRFWPGAFAATASWLVVSWIFSAYAVSIADYALYYGSLAAVAVLLVWLYLTSLSLVIGAEVNARLEGVRDAARDSVRGPRLMIR